MINNNPYHIHTYDAQGEITCCTQEEKINAEAESEQEHDHQGSPNGKNSFLEKWGEYFPSIISFILLITGIILDHFIKQTFFVGWFRIAWFTAAYLPVAFPVMKDALKAMLQKEFFSEFSLMSIATLGAFYIGEYPEGVAVMLFYAIGELFQSMAVRRAKSNIKALLDQRPDEVIVIENNQALTKKAESVSLGEIIQLKVGEKLSLDGELVSDSAAFNTAALTGESKPDTKQKGESVLAGMINLNSVALIKVTTAYQDSKLSKILELVLNATKQKAKSELFIRKFAKIYTPIVVCLALGICLLPYFFVQTYVFNDWLYRALIFLVISCPCALVISIPLGYFGGIGAASKNGILFKGSQYLDVIANIKNVVMDKTGTLTQGVFKVQEMIVNDFDEKLFLKLVAAIESKSTHPVASAIVQHAGDIFSAVQVNDVEEIAGHGLKGLVDNYEMLVGNFKLLKKFNIPFNINPEDIVNTVVAVAINGEYKGYITIADEIKEDSKKTIEELHQMKVKVVMLSGDKISVVKSVAKELNITHAYGDLLPEDKVNKVKELKASNTTVAFVGDGVNDAPVIALSDVGIAMGGLGSDATIEVADIVIQNDQPSKIPVAIKIGKATKNIVWQNIFLAMAVKALVLALGAGGIATMWEAVFADVGVSLLAILNAMRIQKIDYTKQFLGKA